MEPRKVDEEGVYRVLTASSLNEGPSFGTGKKGLPELARSGPAGRSRGRKESEQC